MLSYLSKEMDKQFHFFFEENNKVYRFIWKYIIKIYNNIKKLIKQSV